MEQFRYTLRGAADHTFVLDDEALIDVGRIQGRPCDKALDEVEKNIPVKSAVLDWINHAEWFKELEDAAGETRRVSGLRDSATNRLNIARQEFASTSRIRYVLLAFADAVLVVGLLIEVALTWSVLPSFLAVPKASFLGYMLGAVSLVLTAALEQLINPPLNHLEECLRERTEHRWRSIAWWTAGLLTAAVVAVNMVVLIKLGYAREEAADLLRALAAMLTGKNPPTELPHLTPGASRGMVIWAGVVMVLDCSVLLRTVLSSMDNCIRRWTASRAVARTDQEVQKIDKELIAAETKENCRRMVWNEADRLGRQLAAAAESRDRMLLEEIRARKISPERLDLASAVDRLLQPDGVTNSAERLFVAVPNPQSHLVR